MVDLLRAVSRARRTILGRPELFGPRPHDQEAAPTPLRGRLFRKYVLLLVGLVSLVLLVNAGLHFWFSYREEETAAYHLQQEKARSAARRIEEFVDEIENQLGWTTAPQWAAAPLEQRQFDYVRLLRQEPAITELIQLDSRGKEQLRVSRLAMDVVGSGKDYSQEPSFTDAKKHRIWFGPVYFRKESEPYLTLAMAQAGPNAGVTIAEVNLKLIWDVIGGMKIGRGGYAYVIDRNGRLIAHPDISLVLRDTDLEGLPQVAAARAETQTDQFAPPAMVAKNLNGETVLTAHAAVVPLGWTVFVELPLREALAPLYASMMQSAALLTVALVLAALAALFLARRMTGPIRLLQAGAARIGAGELDRRIDIHTGDELEELAGEFNRMAGDLQQSYADLEKKVEDRTAELKEALDQQTATAEVLGVINSSPGDLAPVFDAILEKGHSLCGAATGSLQIYDGGRFCAAATRGLPEEFAEALRRPHHVGGYDLRARLVAGDSVAHAPDLAEIDDPAARNAMQIGGVRTLLFVALRKDGALLGAISAGRNEVRPFSAKEIALFENFAAQAVIAMENARLLTETREALEQQTATAGVLGVINSSPGDLVPVFDAVLEKAVGLCEAAFGSLLLYDGARFNTVAVRGVPAAFADYVKTNRPAHGPGTGPARILAGERIVLIADLAAEEPYLAGDPQRRALVDLGGARSLIGVPLLRDRAVLGMIAIYRQEVRPFTDKQIALLENFAAQAVIAMENARLITETREALEQQTATAEVLQVINSSPGDLTPVFDAILEKTLALCAASFGDLSTYAGEQFLAVATRGFPAALIDFYRDPFTPDPKSYFGQLVNGEDVRHIADMAAEFSSRPGSSLSRAGVERGRALVELGNARTGLFLALRKKDDALLGAMRIFRQEVQPFTDKQIALVENFAAQAVIAMENARLLTETREALEQQTATTEVLQVINFSPGHLAPVFDAILEKAHNLCETSFSCLLTFNGESFHTAALNGLPMQFREVVGNAFEASPNNPVMRLVRGERLVHMGDAVEDHGSRDCAGYQHLIDIGSLRTMLLVPLRKDTALLGAIAAFRQEVRAFSDKQIALLQNFASQAVIAMENARLITETREALEQQTATAEVLQVINSSPGDLAPVFDAILEKAQSLCDSGHGTLFLRDGRYFRPAAMRGVPEPIAERLRAGLDVDVPVARPLLAGERFVHIMDMAQLAHPMVRLANESGVRVLLSVPLRKGDELFGMIVAARFEAQPFSEKQIALLENFAAQAVIAMENARLITELRQRTHDLQESLEYQTASSDVLKVISRSGAELGPVLDTLVETAARICRADSGFIFRLQDGLCRMVASFGIPAEYSGFQARNPIAPGRGTLAGRTVLERRAVHIEDAAGDPEYTRAEAVRLGRQRTMLGVPLIRDDALTGVITLARSHVEPFTDKQIGLVTTFADQAVIAIENARLFNELRTRTDELGRSVEELKMLSDVGQAVSSTLDLGSVLSTVLTASLGVTWANAGAIFRYIRAERAFRLVEAVGWDEALARSVRDLRVAETETAMGEAVASRTPIQLSDLAQRASYPLRDAALAAGFHSALIVPLVGAERILGAITLMRQEAGEFPPETVRLMQTLASQSVLAIQNARLFREIADKSEQLALASQHKSQFLANMSHELRTPLNAILGYAELLVDGIYGVLPERPRGVLDRIQNNGKHLLALINDVLDLAKIEAGQLTLTLEDYSLPEMVKSVVTATEPLATSKGLKFTTAVQDGLPTAHGDARRVSQVLLNLVGNAIKFTDAGEIEIRAAAERGQFVLTVRDTGPGIADADQERIFGEFQQIDNSNTRKKGGTGLGLAISKRMVEMQGGTISVDSALGQGSTFRVVLPVHVDEVLEEAA
jgi:GAF domain-containing protein